MVADVELGTLAVQQSPCEVVLVISGSWATAGELF